MVSKEDYHLKTLITFEQKVPQSSDASQNYHKSKSYPFKTAAFTLQRADEGDLQGGYSPPKNLSLYFIL